MCAEKSAELPISREQWDHLRLADLRLHNSVDDVPSVAEFLRPIGVEFRNCLKLKHMIPLLQARQPRFLTDAEDGELNVIRSDEEKASRFLIFLEKKGNPKRVIELLYLSLMDSYVDYGEEHHRNLAVMMFERGLSDEEKEVYWKSLKDPFRALKRLPNVTLTSAAASRLQTYLGNNGPPVCHDLHSICHSWLSQLDDHPAEEAFNRLVRALLCTEGLGYLVSCLQFPTCMSNPPCAMRILSTLSRNDCKKLAKHVGCTPEEVNRMEKMNRHPKLHGKTLLQVLRIPECGEDTKEVVAAMLESAQIQRDNYGLEEMDSHIHRQRPAIKVHNDNRRLYQYINVSSCQNRRCAASVVRALRHARLLAESLDVSESESDTRECLSETSTENQSESDAREFQQETSTEAQSESDASEYSRILANSSMVTKEEIQSESDAWECLSETSTENQSESDAREFQQETSTEAQSESDASEYSHILANGSKVTKEESMKTHTLAEHEVDCQNYMLKSQSRKLGGFSIVQRSIFQKQQVMYTPQEFNFYHNPTQLPKSIYNKDYLIEKSVVKKFLTHTLPKLEKAVFVYEFDIDLELSKNEFWPLLQALRNSRLATERESVLQVQLSSLEARIQQQHREYEERFEELKKAEEGVVREAEERMRRERAAELEALHRRWSHMFLETLDRIATSPQLEDAEHHLPRASAGRRHAPSHSRSRNIAGGTRKRRHAAERDIGLVASSPLKGTKIPQQRGPWPPPSSKPPHRSGLPGATPSVGRRGSRRTQYVQRGSSDGTLPIRGHFSSTSTSDEDDGIRITVTGQENPDLALYIYSSTVSRPHDVQNHMIVTIIPDFDQCRENLEHELRERFPGETFSVYIRLVKLVGEKMKLKCKLRQGPLTCRLIPNSTEISRRQIMWSLRNGSRCPIYLVLTAIPSERRDDAVFQVDVSGLDEMQPYTWVVHKNTFKRMLLQPQGLHIPTANQLRDDVAPQIARTQRWFILGLELQVDASVLEESSRIYPQRDEEWHLHCSRVMLLLWKSQLQQQATWATLIGALREIGEDDAAAEIELLRDRSLAQ